MAWQTIREAVDALIRDEMPSKGATENIRRLISAAERRYSSPSSASFNGYRSAPSLHWGNLSVPIEVEVHSDQIDVYKLAPRDLMAIHEYGLHDDGSIPDSLLTRLDNLLGLSDEQGSGPF